jgi:flavorubredoxin
MDIFEYLTAEHKDIEEKLIELTDNYTTWSREQVFDRVKVVCDAIMGHLKKQENLLLNNLTKTADLSPLMTDCQADRSKVEEEIGQLVMVHVDEPGYEEYLSNLLKVIEEHITFSKSFYAKLQANANPAEVKKINEAVKDMVLHTSEYNAIQTTACSIALTSAIRSLGRTVSVSHGSG